MVMVGVGNGCRASNISNLTLRDLEEAKDDKDFPNGKVRNHHCKIYSCDVFVFAYK